MNDSTKNEMGLKRRIGLASATLSGLGVIVGAGIYVLVGIAAGQAGNAVWLAFLIAAVVAGLTALSYARLVRLRPKNAPEFQYVGMAFGQGPAFLAGWLVLWAGVISASAVALGFAGYLSHLLNIPISAGAIGLVVVSSIVLFTGVSQSIILIVLLTIPTIIGLIVVIGISIPYIGNMSPFEMPFGVSGVVNAAALVFFAYVGFESMANLSEEMKNPERDLPRAILLALGISALLYVFVSLSAVSVIGWDKLSQSAAPLADVARQALGANFDLFLSIVSLAATASTVLLLLLAASRAMWAMAYAGALPEIFSVIGKTRRTPWLTIILVGTFASIFAATENLKEIAEFTNFVILIAFAGVNASAIRLSSRVTTNSRFRNTVLDSILPGLGVIFSLWLAANTGWRAAVFGLLLLGVGLLVRRIMMYFRQKAR
jgi:basic amino acid/polyamine antiporter, APA family